MDIILRVSSRMIRAARFFLRAFVIGIAFLSIIPVKKFPDWDRDNLRYFCAVIPVVGIVIGIFWGIAFFALSYFGSYSGNFRGILMAIFTLGFTGGVHMDGLIDTSDAIFSHRDLSRRLEILSDSHVGAFGVISCVVILMLKAGIFAEIFLRDSGFLRVMIVPVLSRLGAAYLLNNLEFAKSDGLAKILGSARVRGDNIFLGIFALVLGICDWRIFFVFVLVLVFWRRVCVRKFCGITGDLIGAFIEISEVVMLFCI